MKFALVASRKDMAGMNIRENLLDNYEFKNKGNHHELNNIKLYTIEEDSINADNIEVDADIIIFTTRHRSAAGTPSLSVHVPGNWGKAELGGKDNSLCIAPASLLKEMYIELTKNEKFEGEITLEATHHGPYLQKPAMFIEIGSSEEQWNNKEYGKMIADTIMRTLSKPIKAYKTMIALGGGHYPREFNKVLLRTDLAIGHICPKYALEFLDKAMLKQAVERNIEKVDTIILDWKGMGEHKDRIMSIIEELGLKSERLQNILKKYIN